MHASSLHFSIALLEIREKLGSWLQSLCYTLIGPCASGRLLRMQNVREEIHVKYTLP